MIWVFALLIGLSFGVTFEQNCYIQVNKGNTEKPQERKCDNATFYLKQYVKDSDWIYFDLAYESWLVDDNYWLGFGFGQNMTNTDLIVCAIMSGEPFCYDCKSFTAGSPTIDTSRDIIHYNTFF